MVAGQPRGHPRLGFERSSDERHDSGGEKDKKMNEGPTQDSAQACRSRAESR